MIKHTLYPWLRWVYSWISWQLCWNLGCANVWFLPEPWCVFWGSELQHTQAWNQWRGLHSCLLCRDTRDRQGLTYILGQIFKNSHFCKEGLIASSPILSSTSVCSAEETVQNLMVLLMTLGMSRELEWLYAIIPGHTPLLQNPSRHQDLTSPFPNYKEKERVKDVGVELGFCPLLLMEISSNHDLHTLVKASEEQNQRSRTLHIFSDDHW